MLGGLTLCELSVDDEGQENWYDNWNNWDENWVQNEMPDGRRPCCQQCSFLRFELLLSTVRWTSTQELTVRDQWRTTKPEPGAAEGRTKKT